MIFSISFLHCCSLGSLAWDPYLIGESFSLLTFFLSFLSLYKHSWATLFYYRSCPSGEGIFTFFSSRARDIVKAINNAHNTNIEQKKKRKQQLKLQDKRRNPLLSFLRRSSTATSNRRGTSTSPKRAAAGSKSASTTLTKSISVMEHLKPDPGPTERQRVQQRQREDEPVEGGFVNNGDKSSAFANKARRSASESDLLGCKINAVDDESDEDENETTTKRTITVTAEINEGFYRSFDDDIDDIDDLVELRSGAKAKTKANGGQTLAPSCEDDSSARRSFQSTDSGRASNASETTCNSSVASSSNGSSTACNRIYSNNSNCSSSVDSGTHVSVGSDCSSSKLEVLREQREAIYGGGMKKIDDTEDEEDDDPTYSRITTREAETVEMMSLSSVPPPLPPRFATVRKSFTLPHNMNNCANEAIYAVVPRRQQRSKEAANNTNNEGLECDQEPASNLSAQKNEDIRRSRPKSLGFTMVQSMEVQAHKNVNIAKDPRVLNKALFRLSLDNSSYRSAPTTPDLTNNQLLKNGSPRKKTLARFLGNDGKASPSYPSLPPPPPNGILKKSSLSNSTPMDLESFQDDQSNDRDLEESHDEEEDVYQDVCRRKSRWQSNDGLATPGSLGGGCCTPNSTSFLTPAGSPRGGPRFEAVAANNNHHNNVCGPKQSSSMFSLTCAALPSPLAAAHGATGGQQQQFPPQPMQQRPRFSAGENRSNSLQREGSATLQPVSLRGRSKPLPPAPPLRIGSLPRSATLNDLELRHASMPPPPPPASVVWVPRSGAPTSTQIRRHSLHLNHRHHNQHLSSTAIKRRSSSSMNRGEDAVVSEEDIPAGHFQRGSVGRRSTRKGSVDDGGNRKQCGCPCDHHHNHQKHHQQKEDIYGYKSEPESVYMDMRKAAASSDPMTVTRALVHKELDATALK